MKELTTLDLGSLFGGWADPEECKRVQAEAFDNEENPNTTSEDWDDWAKEFDKYCLGIED